jgi:hypothetical protein
MTIRVKGDGKTRERWRIANNLLFVYDRLCHDEDEEYSSFFMESFLVPPASGQRNAGRWLAGARFLQVLNEGHFGMREGAWQG